MDRIRSIKRQYGQPQWTSGTVIEELVNRPYTWAGYEYSARGHLIKEHINTSIDDDTRPPPAAVIGIPVNQPLLG